MEFFNLQLVAAGTIVIALAVYVRLKRSSLSGLRGPESSHPILGFLPTLLHTPAGEVDFVLQSNYGGAVKYDGLLGKRLLWICDPKAVHYVAQGSGYAFIRAADRKELSRMFLGKSVLTVEGDEHKRHRRIMLPGFGTVESSSYVPSFSRKAARMSEKWVEIIEGHKGTVAIDIPAWTARATLDALGEAAFDYPFNALDDMSNELSRVFNNLFSKTRLNPSNWEIFMTEMVALLPPPLVRTWNEYIPDRKRAILHRSRAVSERIARQLVEEKSAALLSNNGGHDIMSLLVKANASASAKNGLAEDEVLAQLSTIIIAGHETTATTISWTLLELCKNPDIQTRLRNEIRRVRLERDEPEPTAATFDDMPYLGAVVKETLRYHPAVYQIYKQAAHDEIIPLLRPIAGVDGKLIHEIPVQEGQKVALSIAAYNRDKEIFGQDADSFNPERWLKDGYVTKQASVGV